MCIAGKTKMNASFCYLIQADAEPSLDFPWFILI